MALRWLVTGARGQVGTDLCRLLQDRHGADSVRGLASTDLDITDRITVFDAVAAWRPDVIVNAAAYTAVDDAEQDEDRAYAVNATGAAYLAAAAAGAGAKLLHISTDYVFAGDADTPYSADAATAPRSAYGRTKLAGEQAVRELAPEHGFVVRTAWVYGAAGANFVKTMVRLEGTRPTVSVVDDQRGSPTWSADLAAGLIELGESGASPGTYHCTNSGETTWFGFTRAIFEELGADPDRVLPTTTDAFPRPAPRPAYSVLSSDSWTGAGLTALPDWRDGLARAFGASRAAFVAAGS